MSQEVLKNDQDYPSQLKLIVQNNQLVEKMLQHVQLLEHRKMEF